MTDFALRDAAIWLQGALLGSLATALGILAIAILGMLMLQGRLEWRRGATSVLGCFILFGAPVIARGLLTASSSAVPTVRPEPLTPTAVPAIPDSRPAPAYDPYAGASVPSERW